MDFSPQHRRTPRENIVPMINVVFLLLIFFLMTAQIAPPEPFDLTPPETSEGETARQSDTLYISADGDLAYEDALGDDVFTALSNRAAPQAPLHIRADGGLDGAVLARLLPKLAQAGVSETILLTGAK